MAQDSPATSFHTPSLLQLLAPSAADPSASKRSLAERLGQWLDVADAMSLYSALNADTSGLDDRRLDPAEARDGARQAFERVRERLSASIDAGELARQVRAATVPDGDPGDAVDAAAFQRVYLARQRDMGARIGPLRAATRAALACSSPALARLAALDAVLDKALAARERAALSRVPAGLARRVEQLSAAQGNSDGVAAGPDDLAGSRPQRLCGEMQALLAAELALRLQPVAGLIAAFDA